MLSEIDYFGAFVGFTDGLTRGSSAEEKFDADPTSEKPF